ncbi:MAG: hypothetical protein KBF88_13925, partial [Polyangiaceae bacterium]|nr:hypothetical protein [Polyangiaceae bacterium]
MALDTGREVQFLSTISKGSKGEKDGLEILLTEWQKNRLHPDAPAPTTDSIEFRQLDVTHVAMLDFFAPFTLPPSVTATDGDDAA